MKCVFCERAAERSCTRCGRFFCSSHGGDRLVEETFGEGLQVVTRGLCDTCTPNQEAIRSKQKIAKFVGICAFVFFAMVFTGVTVFICMGALAGR